MRFIVDAQLPPDLALFLRNQGHWAKAVCEVGLRDADDREIWDYALREQAVVITNDEDFALRVIGNRKMIPTVIWLRVGNCSNRALIAWFGPLLPKIIEAIQNGEKLIEII
jgi:predicted nuclease of predicted toxin-antitoxin system